jgi:hypothetical protein
LSSKLKEVSTHWAKDWGIFEWACVITTVVMLGGILVGVIVLTIVGPPPN